MNFFQFEQLGMVFATDRKSLGIKKIPWISMGLSILVWFLLCVVFHIIHALENQLDNFYLKGNFLSNPFRSLGIYSRCFSVDIYLLIFYPWGIGLRVFCVVIFLSITISPKTPTPCREARLCVWGMFLIDSR